MTKPNRMDIITDLVKERLQGAFAEAKEQYKNTNPYRQEPVSAKERLSQYAEFTPEIENMMRQNVGNEAVDKYVSRMNDLLRRQINA